MSIFVIIFLISFIFTLFSLTHSVAHIHNFYLLWLLTYRWNDRCRCWNGNLLGNVLMIFRGESEKVPKWAFQYFKQLKKRGNRLRWIRTKERTGDFCKKNEWLFYYWWRNPKWNNCLWTNDWMSELGKRCTQEQMKVGNRQLYIQVINKHLYFHKFWSLLKPFFRP